MATPNKTMPSKNHTSAPKFDGKPANLPLFLDEVEQLAQQCGLKPKETIEWALRYCTTENYELWSSMEAASGSDWAAFKNELYEYYPGASGDRWYSGTSLEMLIEKQNATVMRTTEQFGTYYRAFITIARYLKTHKKLTDREISTAFIRGFDLSFRSQVRAQLRAENPKHHSDDPYTLKQIADAALFCLSSDNEIEILEPNPTAPTISPPTIKRELYDISSMDTIYGSNNINLSSLAAEIVKQLQLQNVTSLSAGTNNQPTNLTSQDTAPPRPRSYNCAFCSEPTHYQSGCPKVAEYIKKGLCARNAENVIVLPNGNRVNPWTAPGRNIMERIDNWHQANPSTVATVTTNFISAHMAEPVTTNWAMPSTISIAKVVEEENNISELTTREEEELEVLQSLATTTQKKIEEMSQRKQGKANGPTTRSMAKREAQNDNAHETANTKSSSAGNNTPQFKYTTPVEDVKLANTVLERALNASISISNRELLALAPDIRKQVKELVTTKKIPVSSVAQSMLQENTSLNSLNTNTRYQGLQRTEEGLIVANHTEELRALDVMLDGRIACEAILDSGSQIVGLRKDIWQKLGMSVRSDHIMTIESANTSENHTVGLLKNFKVNIGGYDFYLQVQVVENTPYEMLLGLPFKTLTSANVVHTSDNEAMITLVDPNTNDQISVPSRNRNRNKPSIKPTSGF